MERRIGFVSGSMFDYMLKEAVSIRVDTDHGA
jgi:hypothetical protein